VIREARAGEADAVLEAWTRAGAEPSISDDVGSIERLIAHDPGALLVAEAEGRIVGTVIATWDGWRGGIYRLAVTPEWRRARVATRLVDAAEERVRALGAPKVAALVLDAHDHAVAFWRARGYEPDDRLTRWVRTLR
jgi:ribosomal protein S18 acetylase RimI-like enzyme